LHGERWEDTVGYYCVSLQRRSARVKEELCLIYAISTSATIFFNIIRIDEYLELFISLLQKGRQPTYYFMNRSDILRLKEDEEAMNV
jgi:hypothetical protein